MLESLAPLLDAFYSFLEIAPVAVVHDDVMVVLLNERVVVFDNVGVVELSKHMYLVVSGSASVTGFKVERDTFHGKEVTILFSPH